MNIKPAFALIIAAFIHSLLSAQSETYSVKKAWFSTEKYDEFSPVCYKNGIVFCTNRAATRIMNYSTENNKGFIKIVFVDSSGASQQSPGYFSKSLNTRFNDGPVTFNRKGDTIYYSRNIIVEGKLSDVASSRNKLGIFYAIYDGTDWTKIRELRINSEWYNITTPWLSPDGKRLYFASDKPGGYGGADIYYSQWSKDYWDDPVNMGPVINTKGNESYPFMNPAGEFFFASDGHPGLGGKDIFFTRYVDSCWTKPVDLDAPINSQFDDFGIFTDTLMNQGYFSSNRDKSIDIFHFTTNFPQVFYRSPQRENNYCYLFSDSSSMAVDTMSLKYRWSFGDGKTATGTKIIHCYEGPGIYNLRLDILDKSSGRIFYTQLMDDLEIVDFEQAYINAPDYALKGDSVIFNGFKSYLPGYRIISYSWDFGDKARAKGPKVKHSFAKKGEYEINLELAIRSDSTGNIRKTGISRKIVVFDNVNEENSFLAGKIVEKKIIPDFRSSANTKIISNYSSETEIKNDAVFRIELLASKEKLDTRGRVFRNIPSIYTVKESFDPVENKYYYTVDQQQNLMATYPAYVKMVSLGFDKTIIKMVVLTDPDEKELNNLIRINGAFADTYFDAKDNLTSNAYIMLDQIVKFMNKYPTVKLEVGVHNDNQGSDPVNLALTQKRAQYLVNYLINRGVSAKRLVARGYGGAKPIASNILEKGRKLNRRIDFTIIEK